MYVVEILWNTDADGTFIENGTKEEDYPRSLYGLFESMDDAVSWMDNRTDDTDVHEMYARELLVSDDGDYINKPEQFDLEEWETDEPKEADRS